MKDIHCSSQIERPWPQPSDGSRPKVPPAIQNGFTLVELLVVIAIMGIFMAMVLPAVQASRETARRSQCARNLSQLSVAVQDYQMAHEVYPPGSIDKQGPIHSAPHGDHRNWVIHLLPYVDELSTYRHIDQSVGVYDSKNAAVRAIPIAILQCPSDTETSTGLPVSNYAAVHHDVEAPIDVDNHGVFFLNSHLRYDDITDGPSHTLFIGEKLSDPDDLGWMSGTRATLRNTGWALNSPNLPALAAMPAPSPPASGATPTDSSAEPANTAAPTSDALSTVEPTKTAQSNSESAATDSTPSDSTPAETSSTAPAATAPLRPALPADPTLYVGGFASDHPAGVNFAFGDGSVHFLADTIDLQILQQLAHRSDGKLLPASF